MTYRQVDADTFVDDQTKETFRLAGANAMEKRTAEGANLAADTSIGARVNEATPERLGRDYYGRTVARFLNPDGSDLNQQLINEGKMGAVDYTGAGQLYTQPQAPTRAEPTQAQYDLMGRQAPDKALAEYQTPVKAPTLLEKAGRGVRRGTDTAQAGYFGTVSALGNLIARDPDGAGPKTDTLGEEWIKDPATGRRVANPDLSYRDRFSNWMQRTGERGYMRNMQQAEQNPKTMTFQQATESGKLADYSSFAFEAMGEAIPSIIEMLGVGAATALTGGVAGAGIGALATRGALGAGAKAVLERSAQRALVNTTRKKLIAQGITPVQAQALSQGVVANLPKHLAQVSARRGFTAGMFGSSAGMQTGQFYKETENETGVRAPGAALLAGGAAGALDVVGFEVLLGQLLNKRIPINKALDILKPVMAGVAVGVPGEGLTEAAQEVIGVLNTEYHRESDIPLQERMLSKENLWRYAEAGAAGAVFGGAFGGAGGVARGTYDFATRERSPIEAPPATPPVQETQPVTDPGTPAPVETESAPDLTAPVETESAPDLTAPVETESVPTEIESAPAEIESAPDLTAPAEIENAPDLTAPAETENAPDLTTPVETESAPDLTAPAEIESVPTEIESAPDLTAPAETEGVPNLDPEARQKQSQNLAPVSEATPEPAVKPRSKQAPAPKPYVLDNQATPDQQRGFLFDSEEAATQTAKDLLGPLDIPVTPRQQQEVSIAEDGSVIPNSGAFGLATPGKSNDELTVAASEGVAQKVETVPASFLADMDQARTTLGGTAQLKTALTRASPNGWSKDEVVPRVLDTFETLSLAQSYAAEQQLKPGEYLIGRKNEGYAVVDLRGFTQSPKENATQAVKKPALSTTRITPDTFDYGIADDQTLVTDAPPAGFKGRVLSLPVRKGRVPLPLPELQSKINGLIQHAKANPNQNFLIGKLDVPYTNKELAKLFDEAMNVENIALPQEYINYIKVYRKIGEAMRPVGTKRGATGPTETGLPVTEQNQGVSTQPEAAQSTPAAKPTAIQPATAAKERKRSTPAAKPTAIQPATAAKAESKRSTPTQGTTPEAFRAELSAKERKRLDAPNVHVLHRTTDAPFPVAPDTAGLYLPDGSVYFFTENTAPGEAFGKMVHELGAHYGLQRMVGKEVYDSVLAELQRMVNADGFASVKAAYARAKEAGATDEALWHETLAYLAEASPRHGLIRRLVHAIKRFLRGLGIPVGRLTEQDLVSLVQVAAFKEGLGGEGLSGEMLASKRSPTTPYVAQYGTKALKNGKVVPAYAILFDGGKPLAAFSKKVEAEVALKADREGYAQKAKALYESGQKRAGRANTNTAVIEPYQRRLPDGKIVNEWGIRRGSEWLGQGYATKAEAQPAFDHLIKRGSVTKDIREGVPAPNLTVDLRAQEKGKDLPVRQRPEPIRKDTPENLRASPSMEGASPLSPKDAPALDVKPLTGKLGKLAAMMRGAISQAPPGKPSQQEDQSPARQAQAAKDRVVGATVELMLRSERKAPGVNIRALLELYRNALDTGRTEDDEPRVAERERQDATQKRLQKQRRAVALVTELRDAAQVVTAEEDQLAEQIKDFNAAKQRATKDSAFIKELQQSAQEAEQRVNSAKARVEALKTEEATLLKALKKPVAPGVHNLTKRQQAAVAGLAKDYPDLTDRLRAVTAWVSPTDLPLIDHLAKALEALDDYRRRDTSTLYDLDDVLMAEADEHLAARQVEARVLGEPGEGWNEQSMNVEAPTEGFYTLFKGQYFTQALAQVLSPLLKSAKRTEGELRQLWDSVTEKLESVGPIERTLFALIKAANTMVPIPGATLDADTRVVEMKLSDAEAWLNEDPDTTFGLLLLREVQAEDAKLEDPAYAKRNAQSNVGRFVRAMAGLRAWHDRYQVPYGQLYLQYDAKTQQFSITERMTSTNPNAMEVFVDPHTGTATSLLEWVNDYLAQQAKGWKLPGKTGKETEFFRDNVLTLTPMDRITGKLTGKAQKADPLLKTDSQTGSIYVQGKSLTQLGYALAQQQGLMTPENDYQAFMLARAALLDHANLALNTPELMDKNIARSAKGKLTFAQALAQEQIAREGRLPKEKAVSDKRLASQVYAPAYDKAYKGARANNIPHAKAQIIAERAATQAVKLANETLAEPNTLGVPAPSETEGKAAFQQRLNALPDADKVLYETIYAQMRKDAQANQKGKALTQEDLETLQARAEEVVRLNREQQADLDERQEQQNFRKQWSTDSGTAPPDVAEAAQLDNAQKDRDANMRLSKFEERIGETSTKATGNPQNLPLREGGVFGQEGTEAHGLVKRVLEALGFTKTRIHLYTSDQVEAYEAAIKERNAIVWQGFVTQREQTKVPAAVAFTQGEIFLYFDKELTGEALREALSHELGHVVFRVMLNSERERNTPLWNRLFDEYQEADTGQRFMEWFADEAGKWINQRDHRVTNATQGFIKRIVDALKTLFKALGLRPSKGAVAAYMDGLALREKEQAYAEFQRALTGRIGRGYDLTTMQMSYHSRASERIHMNTGELDFITMDGVKQGTIAQAQRLLDAVPALQTAWNGAKTVGQWVTDTLSTANNFLREQNLAELTMHADVLDRGARQQVIEFTTNEEIDELLHDPEWSKLRGTKAQPGVAEAKVKGLKDRANALRNKDWVAGVVLVKYKDRRTSTLEAEIRPIPRESFNAAIQRLYQGQWGSSDEGYRKLLHGKTEAEASAIGQELLRNDPKSETAQALAAWLKKFYKDYVVKGFTGAHSGTVHIGQQENWGLARYYSPKAVEANLDAFIRLLTTTRKNEQGEVTWRGMQEGEAREFATHIITGQEAITEKDLDEAAGLVRPTLSPGAPSKQGRNITLPIEELLPFLETNADAVIARYVHSMIKRVEWEKRFGDEVQIGKHWVWQPDLYGQLTQQALINNHRDTLSANRMKYLLEKTRAINEAYLGRYGAYTTDPRVRAWMSSVQALMNVLVMPLSLLSQAPDLAGPLTRMSGGTGAYAKGLRDAYRAMRNKNSDLWKVAEMYGIVYRDFRDSQAASFFDSQYLTTGPQKLNDWLFKWNGMQMFTNFSRLLSFHASSYWLEDLVTGQHPDAERWLKDLGLTVDEVKEWVKTKKEYTSADGENSLAFKVMLARQRFVQESVFSPNAGQRPLFASHPYAMLVWHLKQFAFSFFTQILKPAAREVMKNPRLYGKMMAVLPLALMMPLAMLGMGLRDELKYGDLPWRGERPSFDKDPEGWLSETGRIIGRTGVLGPLQLLIDADRQQSWGRSFSFALAGPAASKIEELFLADDTTEFVTKALPGLSLLPAERQAFRSWVE